MISNINIKNFKCFSDNSIELKPLTVLSGINAVGKSSFIQSILLCLQSIGAESNHIEMSSSVRISLNGSNGLNLGNISDILNFGNDDGFFRISLEFDSKNQLELTSDIDKTSDNVTFRANLKLIGENIYGKLQYFNKSQYISAERYGPLAIHEESDFKNNVGEFGQFAVSILNNSFNSPVEIDRCFSHESIALLLKSVEEWLNYIIPNTELSTELIVGVEKIKLQIRNSKDSQFIKPSNTGFGISYLLPIVVAGMIAPVGSTLIIENPEAHIHPVGQSRIGDFLSAISEFGVQVIVETHSDHVINGIRLAAAKGRIKAKSIVINFFSRNASGDVEVNKVNVNKIGEISNWPLGFLDQEKIDLKEMFMVRMKK